jgi:hypothetical protein
MNSLVKYVNNEVRIEEIQDSARLKSILNSPVNTKWLKNHPTAKNVKYLPIDKIEILLDMIFQEWRIELLSVSQLAQSVCVTVRVHYKNPITGEWSFHDGVGASPLQTNAGKSAADLANIKNNAVQLAAPAAKSYAIKDAVEHLGKAFGRDINRSDTVGYEFLYGQEDKSKAEDNSQELIAQLKSSKNLKELQANFVKGVNQFKGNNEIIAELIQIKDELKGKLK